MTKNAGVGEQNQRLRSMVTTLQDLLAVHERVVLDQTARLEQVLGELNLRNQELARSNAELEQFAYLASHDLQEPLRMVASYTQLLGERYKGRLDAEADKFIDYAMDGAVRMQRLITDLLTYSRLDKAGESFQLCECAGVVDQAMINLGAAIRETAATVTCGNLPVLMANKTQMVQLLQNLLGNAIKFRREFVPPHVHVSAKLDGNDWLFAVTDNGIGIAPEYFDRIFQVFQRLHTRRQYSGTGIGLAICKRIVEYHGGRIWVESDTERGTTFYFTMPPRQEATQ